MSRAMKFSDCMRLPTYLYTKKHEARTYSQFTPFYNSKSVLTQKLIILRSNINITRPVVSTPVHLGTRQPFTIFFLNVIRKSIFKKYCFLFKS